MATITVLVTGVGGGVGQGILKSLRRIDDIDLKIVTADMSPLAVGLYRGDLAVLVPPFDAPGYLDEVIRICRQNGVNFYFPGTDVELETCSANSERILHESGTRVVVSPYSAVHIANDKYETFRFLKQNGFPYPPTYLANEVEYGELKYPVIVKPRIGCHSIGVEKVGDAAALKTCLGRRQNIVIQELAGSESDEYTCTVVNANGRTSDPVVLRRVLRAGDTYRATPVSNPVISDYVFSIARKLNVYGSSNFQLRTDDGVPKLFEINCRFSGTTPFCAELGANPVEFYLKAELDIPYSQKLRYDVTVFRAWSEVIVENSIIESLSKDRMCSPVVDDYGVI